MSFGLMYLIVCPLVFLAGFVDSIAGGGGIISLPAYMIAGLPAHTAIATNKLSSMMGTSVSTYYYIRKGFMKWRLCIPAIAASLLGAVGGAKISLLIDEKILKMAMLVVLPVVFFYVTRSKALQNAQDNGLDLEHEMSMKLILQCVAMALVVGMYDGMYGPGTGTFLMLLFTGICHLTLQDAAGTTKAINLTTNITSLTVFLLNKKVFLTLGLAAGCCNMLGNYIGSHCFTSKGSRIVKPVMMVVLILFFVKVITEVIG